MAGSLRVVLGDQLSRDIAALSDIDRDADCVLMAEVWDEATYVPHHPKKIAFIFAAMRHFADELAGDGVSVRYTRLDDADNAGSLAGEVARAAEALKPDRIVATHAGEYRVAEDMARWQDATGVACEVREDDRFLCGRRDFADWVEGRNSPRMETFYRMMRRRWDVLMDGDDPLGGQWNFDKENRQSLPDDVTPPKPYRARPDDTTKAVLDLVEDRFGDHFGRLRPFHFGVTRAEARRALDRFVDQALPKFGDYQDAMKQDQPWLFHSLIGLYLNVGLLDPRAVIAKVEAAYHDGHAPLNAVEGFIRQILGWREFVRGIYWLRMPDYIDTNALDAHRSLPGFYWSGETDMNCLAQAIGQTRDEAYAHHIQRLMVTGNFALLVGVEPRELDDWYLAVYADAYEWVELPNTHGMVQYADGGFLASKPYAASGAYIDRMSDYCSHCAYDVAQKTGEGACPFNYLYWDFLSRNRDRLKGNHRMGMIYKTLDRMGEDKRRAIADDADRFLRRIAAGVRV